MAREYKQPEPEVEADKPAAQEEQKEKKEVKKKREKPKKPKEVPPPQEPEEEKLTEAQIKEKYEALKKKMEEDLLDRRLALEKRK